METKGFITKKELSEARMYASKKELTQYEQLRIVRIYLKQVTGVRFHNIQTDHPDFPTWVQVCIDFFKNKKELA